MYLPRLRARQFEVLAVRDCAPSLGPSRKLIPIMEPVKALDAKYARRLREVSAKGLTCSLVLNPSVGDHAAANAWQEVGRYYLKNGLLDIHSLAILSNAGANHRAMQNWVTNLRVQGLAFALDIIHEPGMSVNLAGNTYRNVRWNVAEDRTVPLAYGLPLSASQVVWANDPFPAVTANREYVGRPESIFSARPAGYKAAGYIGVSDYLTVGQRYQPGGGPAYVVAIHLTHAVSGVVRLIHFCSDSNLTQDDPGGKFLEALNKLVTYVNSQGVARNPALDRFFDLHRRQHYPGLGQVKQLSMMNHMFVMAAAV